MRDSGKVNDDPATQSFSEKELLRDFCEDLVDLEPSCATLTDSRSLFISETADILVIWATGWDHQALRESAKSGSYFIQELIENITKNPEEHINDVILRVC